ncbi:hypothetical protein HYT84_04310 [Candidatus Micrarchaeota archaeon]|nr:hypothetical protein [Candidatus Micrarchaeota archaeon]
MAKDKWQKVLETSDMRIYSSHQEKVFSATDNPKNGILHVEFQLGKDYSVVFYFDQNPIIQGLLPKEKDAVRDMIIDQINKEFLPYFEEVVLNYLKNDAEIVLYKHGEQKYSKKELLRNWIAEPKRAFTKEI